MSTVLAVLLLIYVGYQVYNMRHAKVLTDTADYFTASESVQVTGIALRSETLLSSNASGVVDYVLSTGDKVQKKGIVAQVYASESEAAAHRQLATVEDEIKRLQSLQSPGDTYAASPDTLNHQIGLELTGLLNKTVTGDFGDMGDSRENLLSLINERQMVAGQVTDFSARIKDLQTQEASLQSQAGTAKASVLSPASGYFIKKVDGLENVVDISKVLSLTAAQVKAAESQKGTPPAGALGKVSGDYDWYFACVVPASKAAEFKQLSSAGSGTVNIGFPFVSNTTVPASVAAVNQAGDNAEAAVILECSNMNASLASLRDETAQIILNTYTGIRVGKDTVHFVAVSKDVKDANGKTSTKKENVMGVYVINGSEIQFRQIVPEYSTDSYVICNPNPSADDLMTSATIKLHDEVVVGGTDLYDGKVIG